MPTLVTLPLLLTSSGDRTGVHCLTLALCLQNSSCLPHILALLVASLSSSRDLSWCLVPSKMLVISQVWDLTTVSSI